MRRWYHDSDVLIDDIQADVFGHHQKENDMLKATLGRIVHYTLTKDDSENIGFCSGDFQPVLPAIVVKVNDDDTVDLRVYGASHADLPYVKDVPAAPEEDAGEVLHSGTWFWPPRA